MKNHSVDAALLFQIIHPSIYLSIYLPIYNTQHINSVALTNAYMHTNLSEAHLLQWLQKFPDIVLQ